MGEQRCQQCGGSRQALALGDEQGKAAQALLALEADDWTVVEQAAAKATDRLVGDAEKALRTARTKIGDVQQFVKLGVWARNPHDAPRDALTQTALDRLDAAHQAKAAPLRLPCER